MEFGAAGSTSSKTCKSQFLSERPWLSQILGVRAEMSLNTEAMAEAIEPAMHMTEKAVQLAAEGMSFREAYQQVSARSMNI